MPRAVIVGSGPNGLTTAALLTRAGWDVEILERSDQPGGACVTERWNDVLIDVGAAAHPFGVASPAFRELGLEVEWLHSQSPLAHPFDDRPAALLGTDMSPAWQRLHGPVARNIDAHLDNVLAPLLRWPAHPLRLAQFAPGLAPATALARALPAHERALLLGSAVHAGISPTHPFTGAYGLLFGALGMTRGWPVVRGGSQGIIDALLTTYTGPVHTGVHVDDVRMLPAADVVIFNLTAAQLRGIKGLRLPRRIKHWRPGIETFKVDYLLKEPVPWADPQVSTATTVHLGGNKIQVAKKHLPDNPFVIACQQHVADPSRGLALWAYLHVPRGFSGDATHLIDQQIERFAPGFGDVVVDKKSRRVGDIAGGSMGGLQAVIKPDYRLADGIYMASSSNAPGAGVHGMAGYWAAKDLLKRYGTD